MTNGPTIPFTDNIQLLVTLWSTQMDGNFRKPLVPSAQIIIELWSSLIGKGVFLECNIGYRIYHGLKKKNHLVTIVYYPKKKIMEGLLKEFLAGKEIGTGRACDKHSEEELNKLRNQKKAHRALYNAKASRKFEPVERLARMHKAIDILISIDDQESADDVSNVADVAQRVILCNSTTGVHDILQKHYDMSVLHDTRKKHQWRRRATKVLRRITEQRLMQILVTNIRSKQREERAKEEASQKESVPEASSENSETAA